jgi:multidrug efflux pump
VLPHHGTAKPVGTTARNSIGLVLVGGMTIGTIFTLLIVPSLYILIAKEHKKPPE